MKGSEGSQKAKYLRKYAYVDFSVLQSEWDFLENVRQIRNLIIHHHSSVSPLDKDWHTVRKFIDKNSTLIRFKDDIMETDDSGKLIHEIYPSHRFDFIITSPELNKKLLKTATIFFDQLIPQIDFKKPTV